MESTEAVEILLIEDDPDDVKLTLHSFAKYNISNRVHVVTDGASALDFLFCTGEYSHRSMENPPKVVLLDIKLPKVSGHEVLRRIREDERTATLPVVLLTSSREERDVLEGYRHHANSYVVKPVEFDDFAHAIRDVGLYWLVVNVTAGVNPAAELVGASPPAETGD